MKTNREVALEMLEAYQIEHLKKRFGEKYVEILSRINCPANFESFLDDYINKKDLSVNDKEGVRQELKKEINSTNFLNTSYESLSDWRILQKVHDKFSELNPQYDLKSRLYFGTVLSHEISAGAGYEKDIDTLFILFDGELLNLSLQLAKIISQSIPLSQDSPHIFFPIDSNELYENIRSNETTRGRIIGALYFSIYKYPTDYTAYLLNNELQEMVSAWLIESIEYFIFSHEVGHYLNGDFQESPSELSCGDKLKKEWNDEFHADLFGLNKLVELYRSNRNILSLLGPEIFFNFLILREKYDDRIKGNDSHPPATERLSTYRIFMQNFLENDEVMDLSKYQAIIDSLFRYFEILLNDFVKFRSKRETLEV